MSASCFLFEVGGEKAFHSGIWNVPPSEGSEIQFQYEGCTCSRRVQKAIHVGREIGKPGTHGPDLILVLEPLVVPDRKVAELPPRVAAS